MAAKKNMALVPNTPRQLQDSGPIWATWEACLVKFDGRIRMAWRQPDGGTPTRVTQAEALATRKAAGMTRVSEYPPGDYYSVVVYERGCRVVHGSAFRKYTGPIVRPSWNVADSYGWAESRYRAVYG